ncbi:MAG: hypothetical protein M3Q07_11300 [Pseudobdellovibrionaceae bacterium]|nr:hypothetical protein [Pseudobdellovibrionaceae bacterium]
MILSATLFSLLLVTLSACMPASFKSIDDVDDANPDTVESEDALSDPRTPPIVNDPIESVEVTVVETKLQIPAPPASTTDQVTVACADAKRNGTLKTRTIPLFFPAKEVTCEFEKNDNLSRKNEILRARREEFVDLPLQGMTRLCNMKFDAPQQVMRFDDEIVITLNNLVVAASQDYSTRSKNQNDQLIYANGLGVDKDGLVSYKWLPPNGMQNLRYYNGKLHKYCLGLDPRQADFDRLCQIPRTSTNGDMKLTLPQDAFLKLAAKAGLVLDRQIATAPKAQLGFITTGDNDDSDCQHLDFRMNVAIDYIP